MGWCAASPTHSADAPVIVAGLRRRLRRMHCRRSAASLSCCLPAVTTAGDIAALHAPRALCIRSAWPVLLCTLSALCCDLTQRLHLGMQLLLALHLQRQNEWHALKWRRTTTDTGRHATGLRKQPLGANGVEATWDHRTHAPSSQPPLGAAARAAPRWQGTVCQAASTAADWWPCEGTRLAVPGAALAQRVGSPIA